MITPKQTILTTSMSVISSMLELRTHDVSTTEFISPQKIIADIALSTNEFTKGNFEKLMYVLLLMEADGVLDRVSLANGWSEEYINAREGFMNAFIILNQIRYSATDDPVELGDEVNAKVLFSRCKGRVTYVSGKSEYRKEIDFGGMVNVGVTMSDGGFVIFYVEPRSLFLKDSVVLVSRNSSNVPLAPTDEEISV